MIFSTIKELFISMKALKNPKDQYTDLHVFSILPL